MIYIILGIVLLFAVIILYGALSRKRVYREIDQLEAWKIDIMNRPVNDELARVKRLKMIGETEEKFEAWREEWDDILTTVLPNAEEKLFDAEEAADKYRFRKAGAVLTDIRQKLEQAEKRIEALLADLEQFVSSEQQNREDIVTVKAIYHEAKKQLLTNRRFFQNALTPMEKNLQEIDETLRDYDKQAEEGNYLKARAILMDTKEKLDSLQMKIDRIPSLFTELQSTLPEQINELHKGHQEMLEQGYMLDHLAIPDELKSMQNRLAEQIAAVEQTELERPGEEINDMAQRIEFLYDQLEQEVTSRQFVIKESAAVKEQLDATEEDIDALKNETEWVQQSYHLEDENLQAQQQLEKDIVQLRNKFNESEEAIRQQKQAFSLLQDQLESLKARLAELEDQRVRHQDMLQTLRKDEMEARETLASLRKRLIEVKRMVQKSNLPGVPHDHWSNLEEAEEKITEVENKLEQKPLEIPVIQRFLQEALNEVDNSYEQAKKMIDDAQLAEKIIQYGNRYRSRYSSVAANLQAAESSFRNYHYEEALEVAASAVQQVEPHILKEFDTAFEDEA